MKIIFISSVGLASLFLLGCRTSSTLSNAKTETINTRIGAANAGGSDQGDYRARWTYEVIRGFPQPFSFGTTLNYMSAQGWEYVGVVPGTSDYLIYRKPR